MGGRIVSASAYLLLLLLLLACGAPASSGASQRQSADRMRATEPRTGRRPPAQQRQSI
jgi:hypothetical protein